MMTFPLNWMEIKLEPVDNIKYLGIYIDKYLTWNYHIQQLKKKTIPIKKIL